MVGMPTLGRSLASNEKTLGHINLHALYCSLMFLQTTSRRLVRG